MHGSPSSLQYLQERLNSMDLKLGVFLISRLLLCSLAMSSTLLNSTCWSCRTLSRRILMSLRKILWWSVAGSCRTQAHGDPMPMIPPSHGLRHAHIVCELHEVNVGFLTYALLAGTRELPAAGPEDDRHLSDPANPL